MARPIGTALPASLEVVLGRIGRELDGATRLGREGAESSSSVLVEGRSGTGTAGSAAYAVQTKLTSCRRRTADRDDEVGRLLAEQWVEVEQGDVTPRRLDALAASAAVDGHDGAPGHADDLALAEQLEAEAALGAELHPYGQVHVSVVDG